MKGKVREWKVGSSKYVGNPEWGARLFSWDIESKTSKRSIIYWPETISEGSPYEKIRGGNPLLFPFPSVCFDKGMAEAWRYEDEQLPMPRHGFARDGDFEIKGISESGFVAQLIPSEAARKAYPFDYEFKVEYKFSELSFVVVLTLLNKDKKKIPWSPGHHFYFTLPWHDHAIRSDYSAQINFKKCAYYGIDGKLIPEKDKDHALRFDDPKIVDRIHYQLKSNRVQFGPKGGEEWTHIIIGDSERPDPGVSVVTWTESEASPFYCVEPWMGPPNSPEHGKGLHWVNPGEVDTFKVEVSLY